MDVADGKGNEPHLSFHIVIRNKRGGTGLCTKTSAILASLTVIPEEEVLAFGNGECLRGSIPAIGRMDECVAGVMFI